MSNSLNNSSALNSGSYVIIVEIVATSEIVIGALGQCRFPAGYYAYTGSAMKNLSQRVARHRSHNKKIRWHIDYLLESPSAVIKELFVFPSEKREECKRNSAIERFASNEAIVKRFGSSDCRECQSHLVYLGKSCDLKALLNCLVLE